MTHLAVIIDYDQLHKLGFTLHTSTSLQERNATYILIDHFIVPKTLVTSMLVTACTRTCILPSKPKQVLI